jgi:hypothetical protein
LPALIIAIGSSDMQKTSIGQRTIVYRANAFSDFCLTTPVAPL